MRLLHALAALSGGSAITMLVMAEHVLALDPLDADRLRLAAYMQLFAAIAAIAITAHASRLHLIAGGLILAGATLFAVALYTLAIAHTSAIIMLAPVGGTTLIAGWLTLVFAKPRA